MLSSSDLLEPPASAAMKAQHVFENEPDVDGLRAVRALSGAVAGPGIVGGGSSPA
jgi:hypothetical protein